MTSDELRELARKPVAELPALSERARLRNRFGVSQQTLAEKLGVSRRTIHAWEHGRVQPTGANRELYAEILALWAERESKENNSTHSQES